MHPFISKGCGMTIKKERKKWTWKFEWDKNLLESLNGSLDDKFTFYSLFQYKLIDIQKSLTQN